MHGPDVVTIDGDKIGHVVDEQDDYLIVEHGLLKTKHALPREYADVDEGDGVVHTTLSKQLVHDSPKVNGDLDVDAIARHYGLTSAPNDPPTRGIDDLEPDLPTASEDRSAQERVAVRNDVAGGQGPLDEAPYSPGATGGDRRRDYPGDSPKT